MRTIHFLPHSGILCGQWRGGATKPRLPRLSFGLLQLQSLDLESHESHGSHGHPTTVSLFSKPLAESSWSFWYHLLQDQLDPVRHCSRLQITQVDSLRHHWEPKAKGDCALNRHLCAKLEWPYTLPGRMTQVTQLSTLQSQEQVTCKFDGGVYRYTGL